eukprot:TRINITY_DN2267_c1_g1_i2.p1 TRINITY_DN2267_c1_g1~~TRINITY_DN2267_c1_g1_i2.p1  ORF type:complete len:127 (+),score=45.08 TRINITY_DN2267_c1_g1_i2:161-541(+)
MCKGLPPEFATMLSYCKALGFEDKPDYSYLRQLLRGLFIKEGLKYDGMYDWMVLQATPKLVPSRPLALLMEKAGSSSAKQGSENQEKEKQQDKQEPQFTSAVDAATATGRLLNLLSRHHSVAQQNQ